MRTDNIHPSYDRILIKKLKEEKSEGGIYIPITIEDDNTYKAEVIAQGPEIKEYLVGTIVLVGKYAGVEVSKDAGVSILNIKDVLGVVKE